MPSGARRNLETFVRLVRAAWRYRWLVLLTLAASFGSNVAVVGRAPLLQPLVDKIFPREEFRRPEGPLPGAGGGGGAQGEQASPPPGWLDPRDPLPTQIRQLFRGPERVRPADRKHYLLMIALLAACLGVLGGASTYGYLMVGRYVQFRCLNDIRVGVYRHLISLSLQFFHRERSGDVLSRLTNDLALTERVLNFIIVEMLNHPVRILVGISFLLATDWKMTLLTFVVLPLLVVPLLRLGRRVFRAAKRRQGKQADLTQSMLQTFSGIRVIQAFQMEGAETERFESQNVEFLGKAMKVERAKATARGFTELIYSVGVSGMLLVGGILVLDHVMSLGTLLAFFTVVAFLYPSFKSLSKVFNQIQECLAGAERVYQLFDRRPGVRDRPGARPLLGIERSIAFDHVSFSYGDEPVLRDLSFEAPAGKTIALVGPSGGGKSTTLDLIARFYDPDCGAVRVDGTDIREFTRESVRASLALVTQEPFLFNTTVRENIRFGRPDATDAEIEQAARAADIHDFILSLPRGYDSVVGERGGLLSGGQRQRVTIARALLRNPSILLLDEATSSLDTGSESQVQAALGSLMEGRTTFVIAHRLSTVQDADRILVLDRGRLVEQGTHADLVAKGGLYGHLYRVQFSEAPGPGSSPGRGSSSGAGGGGAPGMPEDPLPSA